MSEASGGHIYLSLGSNIGDRARNLEAAKSQLAARGVELLRAGHISETEPFGVVDQAPFLNQVLEVAWPGTARELLDVAKEVEAAVGRTPTRRWGPREIDVDIVLFRGERVDEPDLQIPHPGLRDRAYLRRELAELAPDLLKAAK